MIKGTEEIVRNLLENNPHLRDDDLKLIANIWWLRLKGMNLFKEQDMGVIWRFLDKLSDGDFPHPGSIIRCRAKLQESDTTLRGGKYKYRHELDFIVKRELEDW